jgi:integrase
LCRRLVPYQTVRVTLYAIQAVPRKLSAIRNFVTISMTPCAPTITAEELSRGTATSLRSWYPYTISGHVSKFVRNAFVASGYDIRTVQELLGHKDVKTTTVKEQSSWGDGRQSG